MKSIFFQSAGFLNPEWGKRSDVDRRQSPFVKMLFVLALMLFYNFGHAQESLEQIQIREATRQLIQGNINQNEIVYGVSVRLCSLTGNSYYSSTWNLASVWLNDGQILSGYYLKYDVLTDELNIRASSDLVKIIPFNRVDHFIWKDSINGEIHKFINSLKLLNSNLTGFTEELCGENVKLLKNVRIIKRAPSYNLALDVGDKNAKLIKEEKLYLLKSDEVYRIKSWKDLIEVAPPSKKSELKGYAKENKLFKGEDDFCLLIQHGAF